jgi:hypothetical protein
MKYISFLFISLLIFPVSCKTSVRGNTETKAGDWFNIAVADDVEIFTDTTSIRHEGPVAYAREKRVYITAESKKAYVDKIRNEYIGMGKADKADKWYDFSYCIYNSLYDCTNKRFRVLSVEDYDSAGKLILRTISPEKQEKWLSVGAETVGDYTFFFVCDYQE